MTSYVTPKINTEFITYVGLVDQASRPQFKANPTLAAGDVKVSTDGGAFDNIDTLPTVTPASGKSVKLTLSADEMNGDNIVVLFSDAAGDEWDDLVVVIQTSAQQIDDLASPADIPTTALTESYAADGAAPTLAQAVFAIQQFLQERAVSSTTVTVKKLDGTTTAMTFTLDDASNPSSLTRAS